jgi:DNA-binding NarL/FixJ family response regulator
MHTLEQPNTTRILLVDPSRLICGMFTAVLNYEPDLQVIGCATTVDTALEQIHACDVALVSTSLPDDGAYTFVQAARIANPQIKSVVVGLAEPKPAVVRYIEAGAAGYACRDDSVDKLLSHARAAQRGEALLAPDLTATLMARLVEWAAAPKAAPRTSIETAGLTRREREVLVLIEQKLSNREIADRLVIQVCTVKNHVHRILTKLNANSRRDFVAYPVAER